jgi:hypothetical protein
MRRVEAFTGVQRLQRCRAFAPAVSAARCPRLLAGASGGRRRGACKIVQTGEQHPSMFAGTAAWLPWGSPWGSHWSGCRPCAHQCMIWFWVVQQQSQWRPHIWLQGRSSARSALRCSPKQWRVVVCTCPDAGIRRRLRAASHEEDNRRLSAALEPKLDRGPLLPTARHRHGQLGPGPRVADGQPRRAGALRRGARRRQRSPARRSSARRARAAGLQPPRRQRSSARRPPGPCGSCAQARPPRA